MTDERLKLAVFIDFDNIEIGVKTTLGAHFDVGAILDAIKERGEVITKVAYGDWKRAGDHSRLLTQHAIRMVQRNLTPGGDKNGADINLALDALEMALTHSHINGYVIVGGDSDFISLVEKLRQYDKKVFIVGGRAFTSVILQKNCYEFIAYENLMEPRHAARRSVATSLPQEKDRGGPQLLSTAYPLVERALQVLADREVSAQLGLLKSTLLQLDSAFSERDYGTGSFREFVEKLAQAGFVNLKHSGRSVLVELSESETRPGPDAAEAVSEPVAASPAAAPAPAPAAAPAAPAEPESQPAERPAPPATGQPVEAIQMVRRVFEAAIGRVRWPMYVRNVKQTLRAADGGFDERRYGFGGILDLLRACQREGIFRLERDRQGVLRVFPGVALQRPAGEASSVPAAAETEVLAPETDVVLEPEPIAAVDVGTEASPTVVEAEPAEVTAPAAQAAAGAKKSPARRKRRRRAPTSPKKAAATPARKARTPRPRAKRTS